MKRSELREHIFRMIFGYEFNSDAEMPEQMQLYFEQLDEEDGVPTEAEVTYIRDKALNVILKTEEIDEMLNKNTKGWKTSRMNKVDLSILRLAVYEMKWDEDIPEGVAISATPLSSDSTFLETALLGSAYPNAVATSFPMNHGSPSIVTVLTLPNSSFVNTRKLLSIKSRPFRLLGQFSGHNAVKLCILGETVNEWQYCTAVKQQSFALA